MIGGMISEWVTPTALFFLVNFIIATILFTSSHHRRPENHHRDPPAQQPKLTRPPSLFSRLTSFNLTDDIDHDHHAHPSHAPSLMPRVASFRLSSLGKPDLSGQTTTEESPARKEKKAEEDRNDGEDDMMMKRRETTSFEEEVDAKADDFINKFKQQLKLQRLESLLRYTNTATQHQHPQQ